METLHETELVRQSQHSMCIQSELMGTGCHMERTNIMQYLSMLITTNLGYNDYVNSLLDLCQTGQIECDSEIFLNHIQSLTGDYDFR